MNPSLIFTHLQQEPKKTLLQHEHQIKAVLHEIVIKGAGVFAAAGEIILGTIIPAFILSGRKKIFVPFSNALWHIFRKEEADALLKTSGY